MANTTLPLSLTEAQKVVSEMIFRVKLMDPNPHDNEAIGKIDRICAHWAATRYWFLTPKYHFCICRGDDGKFYVVQTLSVKHKGEHLWRRNTGCIGITMAAMGEDRDNLGRVTKRYPVLKQQVILEAYVTACLIGMFGIEAYDSQGKRKTLLKPEMLYNKVTDALESTGRQVSVYAITDHGEQAIQDRYQSFRYDIGEWKDEFFMWTELFRDWIKAGEVKNLLVGKVA